MICKRKDLFKWLKINFLKGIIKGGYICYYEYFGIIVLFMIFIKIKILVICINMYILIIIRYIEFYCLFV